MSRLKSSISAATKHFFISLSVALLCAGFVFFLWYPAPLGKLLGGQDLFILLTSVDVVCGPLLTLIVFDPKKSRKELVRDLGIIGLLQLIALVYGLLTITNARPVYLAFEGDRFRLVRGIDVDKDLIPKEFGNFSLTGPRLISVAVPKPGDPGFLESTELSLLGNPPAFRPELWREFAPAQGEFLANSAALALTDGTKLRHEIKYPTKDEGKLRHLRLDGIVGEWSVILNTSDWSVAGYLPSELLAGSEQQRPSIPPKRP